MNSPELPRMDRRAAIKWMLTAAASVTLLDHSTFGAETSAPAKAAVGYGTDPDLLKLYQAWRCSGRSRSMPRSAARQLRCAM